jgi:very-short-patch-repair endonuclease
MQRLFVDRARDLRTKSTQSEQKIWHWLRNGYLKGYKFRRQHPVDGYILDFYCARLKLCIEVDGESHDTDRRVAYDDSRTSRLRTLGIEVLRIRNEHIAEQPDGAWSLIVDAVNRRATSLRHSR